MENLTSITEKIQKLWAQAQDKGVTENEAALFTTKVHELLARYNLDLSMIEVSGEERGCVEEAAYEAGSLQAWQNGLAVKVAHLCLSEVFIAGGWSEAQRKSTRRLMFVGTRGNVAMAKALLNHLFEAVKRIRVEEKKQAGMGGDTRWGNSFALGCAARLRERIGTLIQERNAGKSDTLSASESTALVVVAEQELRKARTAMVTAHPHMRTQRSRSSYSSQSGFSAGYQAGGRISLNNQISH